MQEIDIRTLVIVLLRRLKWIVAVAVVGAILMGGYTALFVPETYQSSFSLYIRSATVIQEGQSITASGLQTAQTLVQEYVELLNTDYVLDEVASKVAEKGCKMSTKAVRSAINMSQSGETALLKISANTTDPRASKEICDAMSQVAPEKIQEVMESGKITITSKASMGVKSGPNVVRNAMLGAILGLVASCALFLIIHLMDRTVSDERELKRRMDVPVLGGVPNISTDKKGR